MSRRKRSHKRSSHRRRVSGVSSQGLTDLLGITGGFIGGNILNKKVGEQMTTVDPKILAAGTAVVGLLLSKKGKGIVSSVGKGVFVSSAYALARDLAPTIVAGPGSDLVTFSNSALGNMFPQQSVIGGTGPNFNEMSMVAGSYAYNR